jgi:hypothetical protein
MLFIAYERCQFEIMGPVTIQQVRHLRPIPLALNSKWRLARSDWLSLSGIVWRLDLGLYSAPRLSQLTSIQRPAPNPRHTNS